ncbi:MAG: hypothetical protein EP330_13125 [Deltaproteobacteria bacterium]|nr:MAG: hypothetical protein EP330_13125 [Deltaproteobacteria bacterium]
MVYTRGIVAAVVSSVALAGGFWAYGTKVAGDTRAAVVARQVPALATGDDCAVYDQVATLDPALAKVAMADARFLKGESPATEHRAFIDSVDREIDGFLAAAKCARIGDSLDVPPGHWDDWLALVEGRAAVADGPAVVDDYAAMWRLGHALQRDLSHWRAGAALTERAARGLVRQLAKASPGTVDLAVKRMDELATKGPDLHAVLDYRVYRGELEAFDEAASGLFAGFSGLGLAQAVNVFHPVYDEYVAMRDQPWSEREAQLEAWQTKVDGYAHPIYNGLQAEPVLALERDAAQHRATLEAARLAARVARFRRTYGACPSDLGRVDLPAFEAPLGEYTLADCVVQVGDVKVSAR